MLSMRTAFPNVLGTGNGFCMEVYAVKDDLTSVLHTIKGKTMNKRYCICDLKNWYL